MATKTNTTCTCDYAQTVTEIHAEAARLQAMVDAGIYLAALLEAYLKGARSRCDWVEAA